MNAHLMKCASPYPLRRPPPAASVYVVGVVAASLTVRPGRDCFVGKLREVALWEVFDNSIS